MFSDCHRSAGICNEAGPDLRAGRGCDQFETVRSQIGRYVRVMLIAFWVGLFGSSLLSAAEPERILRVAADPNNLPFSNDRLEGFENRLAELVAQELGARLEYMWWPQRRGFFRETV